MQPAQSLDVPYFDSFEAAKRSPQSAQGSPPTPFFRWSAAPHSIHQYRPEESFIRLPVETSLWQFTHRLAVLVAVAMGSYLGLN
jgi:hypothetical protein